MSDSTQRRGTDYDTLRGMGAGAGSRVPRTADDPLEELARLVSQNEPVKPSAQAAAGEPRSTYTAAPRAPQAAERFDSPPPFTTRPTAPPAFDPREQQRAYGASAQQGYGPSDDFFADLQPVAPRINQNDYAYPAQADDFDTGYDNDFQPPRSPFQDDFDDIGHHQPYADGGDVGEEVPERRRGLFVKLGGIAAALALVFGGGVWAFGALTGGSSDSTPPVIKAENTTPTKVVPEAKPVVRAKESYDRVDPNANANVVTSVEEPGEKPTAPRVILPGAPTPGTQERVNTDTTTASLAPQEPAASEPEQAGNGNSRRVKTMVIRPDGSPAPAEQQSSSSVQALAAAEPPPANVPIHGTGEAAGMSMQPTGDFGIMAAESAPPQQAVALTSEVPMPMPRPLAAQPPPAAAPPTAQNDPFARQDAPPQARAATQAPAPSAGGPPSSPQPQVQITNKRPLKPANVPGRSSAAPSSTSVAAAQPAAQPRSAAPVALAPQQQPARPAAPAPAQSTRPTQVAMASPVPVASVAAPQIAAVSSSSGGAFGVQLTAQRTEQEAIAAFNAIKQRNPAVLGNYNPAIARADLGPDRGIFYRAMVPAASQSDAANLCIQFKSAGVDCIVQRR
jgi:SPOR domain